ncbi:MAG: hypothetical protein IT207_09675 [Fimbriimonadaceae bacterium]|nr:hypothetical protein [Fimbriimonadaceae bacterium]
MLQSSQEQDLQQQQQAGLSKELELEPAENAGTAKRLATTASTMVLIIVFS